MKFIGNLIISAFAVILCAWLMPGVEVNDPADALLTAFILIFLNTFLKPILVILTIPITVITLGIFLIIINAIIIMVADYIVDGFKVDGFFYALIFSIFLSLVTTFLNLIRDDEKKKK